jgi:hypothetical protein
VPSGTIPVTNTVTAGAASYGFIQRTPLWRQIEARNPPDLIINRTYLSVDPGLVLEALRFYAAYPLLRHELGTQAAIERVRRGDVLLPGA